MKPINCQETVVWKQISSNSFKKEINFRLFFYELYIYIHLNLFKRMLNCYCNIEILENILQMSLTKCVHKSYIYLIYLYKEDLALNDLQWLICHKTKPNQILYI